MIHLHNSHASDAQAPMDSTLNQHYEFALRSMDRYDAFISATQKQTADVQERFHPHTRLFTIPVGIVPEQLRQAPKFQLLSGSLEKWWLLLGLRGRSTLMT